MPMPAPSRAPWRSPPSPILAIALVAGICCCGWTGSRSSAWSLNPFILSSVFVVNLIALVYRIVAIVDAYRVTEFLNAHDAGGDGRLGPGRLRPEPAVDRRAPRGHPGDGRQPRRRRPLRRHRDGRARQPCIFVGDDTDAVCTEDDASARRLGRPHRHRHRRARRQPSAEPTETPTPVPTAVGSALPAGQHPAVGRQGAPEHPADRRRRAAEAGLLQHRHADRRLDRPGQQAGRDVQPAARHGRRADPARAGAERLRVAPTAARSTAGSRRSATAPTCSRATKTHARLQRPQGDPRRALRPRHQVLRRGQLRGLPEGRRRARRRDRQRPDPGLGRQLPGHDGQLERRLHPERHPAHERRCRRSATRARATRRTTSTAASASSGVLLSLREQADPQVADPAA